jgi:hypothetical protein
MRSLNLLNYPTLAQERRVFHRWWSSLAGVLVGSSLAWGWQQWQMAQTLRLQQAQYQLQAAWREGAQQAKETARQQTQQRWQTQQAAHLQQIAQHQQAWMAVHDRLLEVAEVQGLRLSRLQSDAGQMELQGEMRRFEAMAAARQTLSDQLVQAITLKNVTVGPASQVSFVWQAAWSDLHSASSAAAPASLPAPGSATPAAADHRKAQP